MRIRRDSATKGLRDPGSRSGGRRNRRPRPLSTTNAPTKDPIYLILAFAEVKPTTARIKGVGPRVASQAALGIIQIRPTPTPTTKV